MATTIAELQHQLALTQEELCREKEARQTEIEILKKQMTLDIEKLQAYMAGKS